MRGGFARRRFRQLQGMGFYGKNRQFNGEYMLNTEKKDFGLALAERVRCGLLGVDARLLVFLCAALGLCAWLLPWQGLVFFMPPALLVTFTVCKTMPGLGKLAAAQAGFALFWALGFFSLQMWERPGQPWETAFYSVIFGLRLYCMLALALAAPLSITPLTFGRVLTWYVSKIGKVEETLLALPPLRGRLRPRLAERAWRCGLALAVMAAFLPRTWRGLAALRQSLQLRAPCLSLRRRLFLLALAALRLLGTQTWDMTLAIASRDLYRPLPWQWRG